jgi:hypothetical protein
MGKSLRSQDSSFHGSWDDLEQFLLLAESRRRSEQRENALQVWSEYKLRKQAQYIRREGPGRKLGTWKSGDYIRSLTAPAIDLRGATLRDVCVGYADFRGVRFDDASFVLENGAWTAMKGAKLQRASLRKASLCPARLMEADLRGADLTDAVLTGANLRGANLEDADLRGANLRGANLERAKTGLRAALIRFKGRGPIAPKQRHESRHSATAASGHEQTSVVGGLSRDASSSQGTQSILNDRNNGVARHSAGGWQSFG